MFTTTAHHCATFADHPLSIHQTPPHFHVSFPSTDFTFLDAVGQQQQKQQQQRQLFRKRLSSKQFHFPSQSFLRYFWYERFGLIVVAEPVGGRSDGFPRKMTMYGATTPRGYGGDFRRRQRRQRYDEESSPEEENASFWYQGRGGGRGRGGRGGKIPKPRGGGGGRGGRGRGRDGARHHYHRQFSPRDGGEDGLQVSSGGGGAWPTVPLFSTSSPSSSSTCSSSQISSYGGMVPFYGTPYVDFEALYGLSPSFLRRTGGGQSTIRRRLRRLEERIALGINVDENGVPFDRELTEEQRERLLEFRAFKKELEREDPFVENAEALGMFLEYEEETKVLMLGCGTSSSSGSPYSTWTSATTVVHSSSSSSNSGSDDTDDKNTNITDDENDESKDDKDNDDETEREDRHQDDNNNNNNNNENEHHEERLHFDLEKFVKDVSENLHVHDDSIDSETEYRDGNSKGTSSGVSSLDVSHEQQ